MQLLWLNVASDPLPALALGLEPPEADVLDQPPHDPRAPILSRYDFRRILLEGTVMGTAALGVFLLTGGGPRASTITFHSLTAIQLVHALTSRSDTQGILAEATRPMNPVLYGAIAASAGLQVAAQIVPLTRRVLRLAPLGASDLVTIGGTVLASTLVSNVIDYIIRDRATPSPAIS
jgi:Ca2+-transporting ATPase